MTRAQQIRELATAQKQHTIGVAASLRRRSLLLELFEDGMTQAELAEILTKASLAAGGETITVNAVQKSIEKYRRALERTS